MRTYSLTAIRRLGIMVTIFSVGLPSFCRAQNPLLEIQEPVKRARLVGTSAASLTGRCDVDRVQTVQLLTEETIKRYAGLATKEQKEGFTKGIRSMFPDDFFLGRILVTGLKGGAVEEVREYVFDRGERVDLKKFWGLIQFREILAFVYEKKILAATVTMSGWTVRAAKASASEHRTRFGNTFSFQVSLAPGRNLFRVWGLNASGNIVAEDSVLFVRSTPFPGGESPEGMDREPFHTAAGERACAPCHGLTLPSSTTTEKPTVEAECNVCHGALVGQTSSHAPAAGWDCLLCHDPSSMPKYQEYGEKPVDASMCFECHTDKQEETTSKPVVHAPVSAGECRLCHDPHGTAQPSLLVEKVNVVCLSCHEEMGSIPHPVANHPVGGKQIPGDPPRELTCARCHNPHASENEHLTMGTGMALCQQCHRK